jgi:transcription elongation factor GreA
VNQMLITPTGLIQLQSELEELRTFGRQAITDRIRAAISTDADASANADYQAAREEQMLLEARIARLEQRLAEALVAEPDHANGVVDLGERVRLHDLETGARLEYELVGSFEADPTAGRISAESPLGQALIGRHRGEVAAFQAPRGLRQLRILTVT